MLPWAPLWPTRCLGGCAISMPAPTGTPLTMEWIKDLGLLQGLLDGWSWTDHAAGLMPDSAWRIICVTNVDYYVYHNLATPIQGPTDLSDGDESDDDNVAGPDGDEDANPVCQMPGLALPELCGWSRAWLSIPGYKNRHCVFKCMAWLDWQLGIHAG